MDLVAFALASTPLRLRERTTLQITASFGVASYPVHATTPDALIAAADLALYAAKQAGRNRVERAIRRVTSTPYDLA
ncbi:diguanylate cyclase [Peristeroidobacter agariperforans]|uniref:diguanylate cyclase n=1 Tax=Peristeroidobacter agariperforans TaxID=268404 RepID=UPI0018E4FBF9|nr:diguanylate cyclase [Peristeroidobacter agariperforans]